jgi:alpha-beta hydrolase superfamily lysophospholipase
LPNQPDAPVTTLRHRAKRILSYLATAVVSMVIGGVALFVIQARRGPDLQPWHTARLTEEFTVDRAGQVRTLEAYLELEARLFEQLDELVYDVTDTGPATELARYSPGSRPDPRGREPNWNRTYLLDAPDPVGAVLLLHGLSDSPYSLRGLAQGLNAQGYRVLGLRLPGHGTAPSGLLAATWEDMAAATRLAMTHLESTTPDGPVHIVGYSTGAALALHYTLEAVENDGARPTSLVMISPALGVTPLAALARWNRRLSHLPGLAQLAWQNILPEFDPYKYGSFTFNAGDQVHRLTRSLRAEVEDRSRSGGLDDLPPILAFLSTVDATVSADAVIDNLFEHLPPGRSELVLFDVNRNSAGSTVLRNDPADLTARLLAATNLPFDLTLIGNHTPSTDEVVVRRRRARAAASSTESLGFAWPQGVISLSHVALPFPPDDPLYGEGPPVPGELYLGRLMVQGERGLLLFPDSWLLRIRHNPFYPYLEARTLGWLRQANDGPPRP